MNYEFGYGKGTQVVSIPKAQVKHILHANEMVHENTGVQAVEKALFSPIQSESLQTTAANAKRRKSADNKAFRAVIITSDISRPCPSWLIVPSVIAELNQGGVTNNEITVVFALGSHRGHSEEEMRHLVGDEVYETVKCVDSTPLDTVHMGTTSRGTDVDISRIVAEADFRIGIGNIEYHYFAGFSGGAKAIMPGVSTPKAIEQNHSLMTDERAKAGNIIDNPIRLDIEEAERLCPLDFIVNVVLDEHKNIVFAVAGDVTAAHRVGCEYLKKMYACPISEKADIVIVSQGGAPKDANLYQTQKALDNAKHAVRDGGVMIVVGACNEGFGSAIFEEWLTTASSPQALVDRIGREFRLGGHKAAAIAQVQTHASIYLVSEMNPETVKSIFMTPFTDLQEAFDTAAKTFDHDPSVILMPFGGSTLPLVQ